MGKLVKFDLNAVQTISTIDLRAMVNAARAVAGEEEIRNDNFILKVEDELEGELNLPEKKVNSGRGRPSVFYTLTIKQALLVAMRESKAVRRAVADRLEELEDIHRAKAAAEQERIRARQRARLECPELTDAIKRSREAQGKKVMFFHYSNEFDMINRIALGQTAKQFRAHHQLGKDALMRDHMSVEQTKAIEHLQRVNTALVDAGLSAEQRKGALEVIYTRDHEHLMIAELIQQESM